MGRLLTDGLRLHRDGDQQQGKLTHLAEPHPGLAGQNRAFAVSSEEGAVSDRLDHKHTRGQRQGGWPNRSGTREVKSCAEGKKEHHEEEVAQWAQAFGDKGRNGAVGQSDTADEGADFIGKAKALCKLCKAQTPPERQQEHILPHFVETLKERSQQPSFSNQATCKKKGQSREFKACL